MRLVAISHLLSFLSIVHFRFVYAQDASTGSVGWPGCIEACMDIDPTCSVPGSNCYCTAAFSACVTSLEECSADDRIRFKNKVDATPACQVTQPNEPTSGSQATIVPSSSAPVTGGPPSSAVLTLQRTASPSSTSQSTLVPITRISTAPSGSPSGAKGQTFDIIGSSSTSIYTEPPSTSTSTPSDDANHSTDLHSGSEHREPNTAAIVGGIVGVLFGILFLVCWIVFMKRRTREATLHHNGVNVVGPKPIPVSIPYPSLKHRPNDLESGPECDITSSSSSFYPEEKVSEYRQSSLPYDQKSELYGYGYGYSQNKVGLAA